MITESSPSSGAKSAESMREPTKLLSLLALAAGAAALPQTSEADIIFTDLSSDPAQVGSLSSSSYLIDTLPGTARLGFAAKTRATSISYSKIITAGQKAGYVRIKTSHSFVVPASAGKTWDQVPGVGSIFGTVATAFYFGHSPGSYNNKFLSFRFKDSTLAGSPLRYGWIEVSLSNPSNGGDPNVTIFGYAYDNTGAQLPAGAVPEPAPMGLLALGALALGAKGLRSWRRARTEG